MQPRRRWDVADGRLSRLRAQPEWPGRTLPALRCTRCLRCGVDNRPRAADAPCAVVDGPRLFLRITRYGEAVWRGVLPLWAGGGGGVAVPVAEPVTQQRDGEDESGRQQ